MLIKVLKAKVGTKLILELESSEAELDVNQWSVKDEFNGLVKFRELDQPLYGFFLAQAYVNLYLYKDGHLKSVFENVKIEAGE